MAQMLTGSFPSPCGRHPRTPQLPYSRAFGSGTALLYQLVGRKVDQVTASTGTRRLKSITRQVEQTGYFLRHSLPIKAFPSAEIILCHWPSAEVGSAVPAQETYSLSKFGRALK